MVNANPPPKFLNGRLVEIGRLCIKDVRVEITERRDPEFYVVGKSEIDPRPDSAKLWRAEKVRTFTSILSSILKVNLPLYFFIYCIRQHYPKPKEIM